MTSTPPAPPSAPSEPPADQRRLPFREFVALLALLTATVSFSTDAMLPLLSVMGQELAPHSPGNTQLVITVFFLGMGMGTFFAGSLSDRYGRKPVILGGIAIYMLAAVLAAQTESLETLLVARFVQGLGVAAPRVVGHAMVRDLYSGRMMARVTSFAMTIFVLVPAVAPMIGAQIGGLFGWRAIFWSFLIFGAVSALWLGLRQPETLPRSARRAFDLLSLGAALKEILVQRRTALLLVAISCSFAPMFAWLSSTPLIFETSYDRSAEFPYWFALVALVSAPAGLLNARLVMQLGMLRLAVRALTAQLLASTLMLVAMALDLSQGQEFACFVIYMMVHFFCVGLLFGNLNALALEPLGHVAGLAASMIGGISAIAAALIATPVAWAFDGTPLPLTVGAMSCALLAMASLWLARRDL